MARSEDGIVTTLREEGKELILLPRDVTPKTTGKCLNLIPTSRSPVHAFHGQNLICIPNITCRQV